MSAPILQGQSLAAVEHRGSHIQIIASAGSGKTEVVSQRVAALLAEGAPASSIVAFTFTERAAASLKERISARVAERLGPQALDQLGGLYVGTIHAYCFRLLQTHVPRYETFDVLDENQLTAFLVREATRLQIKDIDGALFKSIRTFLDNLDVVENELLVPAQLDDPFRSVLERYYASLEKYRLLTYGQQIARAVAELDRPDVRDTVLTDLRHLIVDEYQDVNPAQEALIQRLAGPNVNLVVVGDDDQAIYGWRGSDVSNITSFAQRYDDVATFSITENRRSRPTIVETADRFARSIPGRLPKVMTPTRPHEGVEVVKWHAEYEDDEAAEIAEAIFHLHKNGLAYRDIAILVRGRASYPALLTALEDARIPVQPAGRTGLFVRPEAEVLGKTFCWLVDHDYRPAGWGGSVSGHHRRRTRGGVRGRLQPPRLSGRGGAAAPEGMEGRGPPAGAPSRPRAGLLPTGRRARLQALEPRRRARRHPTRHVGPVHHALGRLRVGAAAGPPGRRDARRTGRRSGPRTLVLQESRHPHHELRERCLRRVRWRAGRQHGRRRPEDGALLQGSRVAGRLRSVPHQVALSVLPDRQGRPWLIDRALFDANRYEGSDADERRLFYVAMTRARDWLSLSRHERVTKNQVRSSPYWDEMSDQLVTTLPVAVPALTSENADGDALLQVTFSELAAYDVCGLAYRLRSVLGFQPTLAPELGYGKAVHHVMRTIAERTKATGSPPDRATVDRILDDELFLPAANKVAHREMKDAARRLVNRYIADHESDLQRVWMTERPFELHLGDAVVSGRADVILDQEGGVTTGLAIIDYKTSTGEVGTHDLQLQVYADAGRREGLDVRGAYVHDLKRGARDAVDVEPSAITAAEAKVTTVLQGLRQRQYAPKPGTACRSCDVKVLCKAAQ
jgi:DNA helicase-2/ATP-dependent DNA helicase PcrA